ncbi:DUF1540 domain-containing protein [Clostridium sp. NSJ-49]|uniref:Domain of Uncharacterized Function (DUF1540) n=1 Tax=Clostridium disporicum TaxID=84024 RepID=A0A174HXP5_9CLOT|nr:MULTISPECIES: DUF1540 domain-containing protein [Clostridium]MBC5624445.1 DUF1540 domain-containing protein [Clostridium sp. NSJ-49]MCD2501878.1 DUF1540 domain-containing protein [Clostridium sp. NSJ-145]CUO77595.1 Domain of Uncharacterised Function (DUF1540) [Clostridium disporicum]
MTNLICNVESCIHNNSACCCKEGITVGGSEASSASATCCDSFEEKHGAFTSNFEAPHGSLNVQCEAENCTYNENRMCAAEAIHIAGMNACTTGETECNSFVPKL